MTTVVDAVEREAAIDTNGSFCVSAPAGSGKTELLIQRYLGLLSRVARPEQVLAITFTRKAAAEMRERVIEALQAARLGAPCASAHEQVTRQLAEQALAADDRANWHMVRDISRLNIKTIDSFCAGLTRQMPILSQLGGQASVQDDGRELYAEAIRALFHKVEEDHPVAADLSALMLHFDNNWERLQDLLVTMLARREQWRGYVGVHHAPEESEDYLVHAVETVVRGQLDELASLLAPYHTELLEALQFTAKNLGRAEPKAFPVSEPGALPAWRSLRNLLLTQGGTWRKQVTKRDGFPADKGEPKERKEQFLKVLAELREIEGLEAALAGIGFLPEITPGSAAWQLVLHLSRLLPLLAAQLLLVFEKNGVVDHSQIAQSALLALGDDDTPTDLALRLDYNIEHILVDEFQDTAVTQFDLLHKLTRGWGEYNALQPDNPRTLMIVGDGMQSIYGFRGANVGLFLKAQREGFNGVELTHLSLRCNFRSDAGVVDWINDTFVQAFPQRSDINRSQVSYSAATAVRPELINPAIAQHAFCGDGAREREVAFVCEHIAQSVEEGATVAVLGRSRSHLQAVIAGLRAKNIAYNAQDLDSLAQSPVVVDMFTLCRALASDTDRLAWMSLLRAPWCGMPLADLLTIATFREEPVYTPLWHTLNDRQCQDALSGDGRERLLHILAPLGEARAKRDRLGLRVLVERLWLGLGGPNCVSEATLLQDAENFLQLLEEAEIEGVGLAIDWLTQKLEQRYMSGGDPDSLVQLMTLHKAKGLEFERVVIPQLDRQTRGDERAILLWDEYSNAGGERSFLLAADDHSDTGAPTLYNFLREQRKQKSLLETTRLLYVGATRAVSHLLLTATLHWDEKTDAARAPAKQSLLSPIWPVFECQMVAQHTEAAPAPQLQNITPVLSRLRRDAKPLPIQPKKSGSLEAAANTPERPDNHRERSVGTVVHRALEELSQLEELPAAPTGPDSARWRLALQREGLWGDVLEKALVEVLGSVQRTLRADGEGRWVLSPGHTEARSEWALTMVDSRNRVQDIVIDRSFIDTHTGERWIVDYKNSQPAQGESLEDFTARESATYTGQLQRYRDALRSLGGQALRCALFFTALGHLHPLTELDLPALDG